MANGPGGHRPRFLIDGSGATHAFSSPRQGRGAGPVPPRDRPSHAAALRAELAQATPAEEDAPTRLQLEFQSFEGIELATESLARDASGIELLNVRQEGERTFATISVPAGKMAHFDRLIERYLTEHKTKTGVPRDHQKLVDAIEHIRAAKVRALWTDEAVLLPATPQTPIQWEVWLPVRDQREAVIQAFRQAAEAVGWSVSERSVHFPERTVLIAVGTQAQLESSNHLLSLIAELRACSASIPRSVGGDVARAWSAMTAAPATPSLSRLKPLRHPLTSMRSWRRRSGSPSRPNARRPSDEGGRMEWSTHRWAP